MFHSNTERLIDYWRARKEGRFSPPRSAIDPTDLTDLLPQMFILGRSGPAHYRFRLAGGTVSDLHKRDLRGVNFLSLWAKDDRPQLGVAIESAFSTSEPVAVSAEALTDRGDIARFEIALAPLRAEEHPHDRCLGLYQPVLPIGPLRTLGIGELELTRGRTRAPRPAFPRPRLVVVDGRLVGDMAG
jgi:hypothetical protein